MLTLPSEAARFDCMAIDLESVTLLVSVRFMTRA
jgi:hypothetical protein